MTQTDQACAASTADEEVGAHVRRRVSGIYQIRNRHTGRVYIGKSRDIPSRWLAHRNALDRGVHVNEDLQGDWEVYGERAFEFTTLEEVIGLKALQNAEARHLAVVSNPYNVVQVLEIAECQPMLSLVRTVCTPEQFFSMIFTLPCREWLAVMLLTNIYKPSGERAEQTSGATSFASLTRSVVARSMSRPQSTAK